MAVIMSAVPELDPDLLKKYDRAGPRYTSYPTAPSFHTDFGPEQYSQALQGGKPIPFGEENPDLSLYFHIPFCDTLCYFCGCSMIVSNNRPRIQRYVSYLQKEMEMVSALVDPSRKVQQLHWGGGTPTHLSPSEIRSLGEAIHKYYSFSDDCEASCEIDPRELSEDHLRALRDAGFQRISLGLQDLNPRVQKAVNRIQSLELTSGIVSMARKLGFQSINIDLIYGLPHQSVGSFAVTLEQVLELDPDRIALFNFAYLPKMFKHHSVIQPEDLPSASEKLQILIQSVQRIATSGYRFIGMDHFAKKDDELSRAQDRGDLYRNFQGYSTRKGLNLIAHGITGIGQVGATYSQNLKTEKEYFSAIDEGRLPVFRGYELNRDDIVRRHVITEIMCHFSLNFAAFEKLTGQSFRDYFAAELNQTGPDSLQSMAGDQLLRIGEHALEVLPMGRFLVRNIAMCFDSHLARTRSGGSFSRTI
ncbi:MAG: oxygen-independent coproporphyrinogen III oxidase [Leptospiraceae bacterium]|nr:oxygen-independent coproporphyrinogen III oxidase [Leptospiraceae bacterium]